MTPFMFATAGSMEQIKKPGCGACHPGGGGLEFDRDGQRYDQRLAESPELAESLDGDYYRSAWNRTGVMEADCFLCHLANYDFPERVKQLKKWNLKWAATAGSGIATVAGFVRDGEEPRVEYNRRFFNEDGRTFIDFSGPPLSNNCTFCHGVSDRKKRGFSWNDPDNHDIHNLQGMHCTQCHRGNEKHNFAKGDENISSVRDDLDNTMLTCRQCHQQGVMGAPRPKHLKVRPSHLERLGCEVCHIPAIHVAAAEGLDVTTGSVVNYPKLGAKKIGQQFTWQPRYHRDEEGRLRPVNALLAVTWSNLDADGIHYPLFGREIKKAYQQISEQLIGKAPNRPKLHTPEEISLMLTALNESLQGNQRFTEVHPAYHKGGRMFWLDEQGQLQEEEDHTWAGHIEGFSINHNVAPPALALGANGCDDCHANEAHMFKGLIATSLFGDGGEPEFTRSGRLFGCRPWIYYTNMIHQQYVTPHLSLLLVVIVFLIVLHYTGQGPKLIEFFYTGEGPKEGGALSHRADIQRFRLSERWTHLFRMTTFLILAFTGVMFFYNKISWIHTFFGHAPVAVQWHWIAGLVFLAASVVSFALWIKDARLVPYDKQWLRERGGYLGEKGTHPPAGRLNAGQKIFFWLSAILSLIVGVTGVVLIFKSGLPVTWTCLLMTIHGFFALIFVATIIAHAYLGTIANPGTWRVLIDGKVSRAWAEKHHSEWYREVMARES